MEIGGEPAERIVCGDEAAVNILTTYRENGWARQGVRARKCTRFVRGTRCVSLAIDNVLCAYMSI
jgi:hypothetical protein